MNRTTPAALREAERYLDSLVDNERRRDGSYRRFDLAPIRGLLHRLGHPERGLSILHIAGSKGKGSTALFAEALLRAAGERVGTFTSPHLERWTERFRVDGREAGGEELARAVAEIRPCVEAQRTERPAQAPTFFDATTAAALVLFARAGLRWVVLEVGLGGRLDATNAVTPALTCITSIELEHTEQLGHSLAAIAGEKAGILKTGVPLVLGAVAVEAERVIMSRARDVGAPVVRLGRDFEVAVLGAGPREGLALRLRDGSCVARAELTVLGRHQAGNAALAVAAVRRLLAGSRQLDFAALVRRGLAAAQLPGRVEILSRAPWQIVDSAHTRASARALADTLAGLPCRRWHLVLSVSAGKDLDAFLQALLPLTDRVTATCALPQRSLGVTDLAQAVAQRQPDALFATVEDPEKALRAARHALRAGEGLCATGSVYLAGIARRVLPSSSRP